MRPGRHGGMSSGEFENILTRNSNFMAVRRAGSGDGYAGFYCAITGEFVLGINGGWLKEHSYMKNRRYGCECTPKGLCRTGAHGTLLVRGWRNVLWELVSRGRVKGTDQIHTILGTPDFRDSVEKLMQKAPTINPSPEWEYSSLRSA